MTYDIIFFVDYDGVTKIARVPRTDKERTRC